MTTLERYPAYDDPELEEGLSPVSVVLAVVATIAAGIAVAYGRARDDTVTMVVGVAVFSTVLVLSAHAVARVWEERWRVLVTVLALLAGFLVLVILGTPLFEKHYGAGQMLVIPSDDPGAAVYLHASPEGRELTGTDGPKPMVAGEEYQFECQVLLGDGQRWIRSADTGYWVPASAMRAADAGAVPELPTC